MLNFTGKRPFSTPTGKLGAGAGGDRSEPLRSPLRRVPRVLVRPRFLSKGQTFLDMPDEVPEWEFDVGEPWRPSDYRIPGERSSDAARRITAELRDYFEKRTQRG